MYMSTFFIALGVALQTSAQNIGMYCGARIILGFGIGNASSAAPLLITEIATERQRGWLVGLYFTMFNAGAIIASAVGYRAVDIPSTWAWRMPSLIQALPSLISLTIIPFVPESPRWKMLKGDYGYAREVFSIMYENDQPTIDKMLNEVEREVNSQEKKMSVAYKEFFTLTPGMLRRWAIVISLSWVTEMGGSSIGSYYLTVLLEEAGIKTSKKKLQINMISSCWSFVVSIIGAFLFDTLGRKKQSLFSLSGMIVCLFMLGGFIKMYGSSTNTSGQYATIFWMFLFNFFYGFCFTPMTNLYPSEIFPTRLRTLGSVWFRFWNCGFGLLGAFVLSLAMDAVGWKFYIINASYDILFLPVIYYVWVETKNLTLEEIDDLFETPQVHDIEVPLSHSSDEKEKEAAKVSVRED